MSNRALEASATLRCRQVNHLSVAQEQAGQRPASYIRDFCGSCIAFQKQARCNQREVTTRQELHSVVGAREATAKVRDGHLGGA